MFNNEVFSTIYKDFNDNKNSHSYIFYTNDFFACQNDLNLLVKKIFNVNNLNTIISDYIVIEKSEKKNILKEDVFRLKDMFQNKSYLNKKRIYLIEEAHKLNSTSANMILKFLEEPLEGIVAFFITTNLDAILSTIKSRCQIVNAFYKRDNDIIETDATLIEEILKQNKYVNIFNAKKIFEKYDRNNLIDIFNKYLSNCYNDLGNEENLERIKIINKAISMLNNNVNTDYVLDYLFLEGCE